MSTKHSLYSNNNHNELIQLFEQTFTDSEGAAEGELIRTLIIRFLTSTPKSDFVVFTTYENAELIAGVVFSKLSFENSTTNVWLLSPMAVKTSAQGKGIGQALIAYAHSWLKNQGVEVVVTYGDINFYSKVGYQSITTNELPAPYPLSYPEGWIAQSLTSNSISPISGKSFCVEALAQQEIW